MTYYECSPREFELQRYPEPERYLVAQRNIHIRHLLEDLDVIGSTTLSVVLPGGIQNRSLIDLAPKA